MGHSLPPRYEIKSRHGYDARRLGRVFRVGEKSPVDGYVRVPSNASRCQMEERPQVAALTISRSFPTVRQFRDVLVVERLESK